MVVESYAGKEESACGWSSELEELSGDKKPSIGQKTTEGDSGGAICRGYIQRKESGYVRSRRECCHHSATSNTCLGPGHSIAHFDERSIDCHLGLNAHLNQGCWRWRCAWPFFGSDQGRHLEGCPRTRCRQSRKKRHRRYCYLEVDTECILGLNIERKPWCCKGHEPGLEDSMWRA